MCLRHAPAGYTKSHSGYQFVHRVPWTCISPSKASPVLLIRWYLSHQRAPRRLLPVPRQTDLSGYQKQKVPKIDPRQLLPICGALLDLWRLLYSCSNLGVDRGLSQARFTAEFTASRLHPATPVTPTQIQPHASTHFQCYLSARPGGFYQQLRLIYTPK